MKQLIASVLLAAVISVPQPKAGRWLDTTEDTNNSMFISISGDGDLILTEDYEVVKTHEVCASVDGYYLEKSDNDRYDVRFKGLRTSSTFTFTDRHAAEKLAEKFCTPESFLSITAGSGRGQFKRNY